jgi:glutamine synthetase
MKINIEAETTLNMGKRQILPACCEFAGRLGGNVAAISSAGVNADAQITLLEKVTGLTTDLQSGLADLEAAHAKASGIAKVDKQARAYRDDVIPAMNAVRAAADELEGLVDADLWPIPTYAEMLFIR